MAVFTSAAKIDGIAGFHLNLKPDKNRKAPVAFSD
jgi:hypothetical protein